MNRKRNYDSTHRKAQATATRQRILDSAERLFVTHGYAATTIGDIASDAGVSIPTITAAFGTKLALLNAVIATTVRGDDTPALLIDRDWWKEALAEPDPLRLIERYAANVRRIHERTTDIFEIVRGAATADAEIAVLRQDMADGRLRDSQQAIDTLAKRGALRTDITVQHAGDVLWVLVSAELYRMLAIERGWNPDEYERWLAASLADSLLGRLAEH